MLAGAGISDEKMFIKPRSGLCAQKKSHDHAALNASCRKNKRTAKRFPVELKGCRRMRHSAKAISA
jgi:ribosomal protein S10